MGLMTNITIQNDTLNEINDNPQQWWKENVYPQICSSQARELYKHSGTTVNSVEHASSTTILAVGGNHTTILGHSTGNSHHTQDGQIEILKELAAKLGYNLTKKRK